MNRYGEHSFMIVKWPPFTLLWSKTIVLLVFLYCSPPGSHHWKGSCEKIPRRRKHLTLLQTRNSDPASKNVSLQTIGKLRVHSHRPSELMLVLTLALMLPSLLSMITHSALPSADTDTIHEPFLFIDTSFSNREAIYRAIIASIGKDYISMLTLGVNMTWSIFTIKLQ